MSSIPYGKHLSDSSGEKRFRPLVFFADFLDEDECLRQIFGRGADFMVCHECLRQIFPDASEEYLSELLELRSFKTKEMATGDLPPEAEEMIPEKHKKGVKDFMEKNAQANAGATGYNAELAAWRRSSGLPTSGGSCGSGGGAGGAGGAKLRLVWHIPLDSDIPSPRPLPRWCDQMCFCGTPCCLRARHPSVHYCYACFYDGHERYDTAICDGAEAAVTSGILHARKTPQPMAMARWKVRKHVEHAGLFPFFLAVV